MNILSKAVIILLAVSSLGLAQQNTVLQTSTSAAMTATQNFVTVASATGINAPTNSVPGSQLYIVDPGQMVGETVTVTGPLSGTRVPIARDRGGKAVAHVSGAMVLVATSPQWFQSTNPAGSCTASTVYVTPWVNVGTGQQWICSSKTLSWVPGWGNPATPQVITATATASVAGATAINAPLVHISGTNAITSFTFSAGNNNNNFQVIPDGAFTGTATNNICKAFTAVANRTLSFTYDAVNSCYAPSY
jgi:hypothetical protein